MKSIRDFAFAVASVVLFVSPAAAEVVAVVEDVAGKVPGVEFMDYVNVGQVITLGPQDSIVLGYLRSCARETITGGTVTVGTDQSSVRDGKIDRATVRCDSRLQLTTQQSGQSAGMVFRGRPTPARGNDPRITIYGQSPIVEAKAGDTLVLQRLDAPAERLELKVGGPGLARAGLYDLAKTGQGLTAGGIYRASVGSREIVFRVDASAQPGQTPAAGRILRFEPAS